MEDIKADYGEVLHRDDRFLVSTELFRTPRQTYQISRLEKTEVRRSALPLMLPICVGMLIFYFWAARWLYWYEELLIVIAASLALLASLVFGTLSVGSKALSEVATLGYVGHLQIVRRAIDDAIRRHDTEVREARRRGIRDEA